ncbi:hypothetical protein DYBT9275_01176 [Dyadobacter sp. CECT 9275]|uniref:HTH tetR-type domain-containing protein n=1 Tax=Dyadobacter helix TaxID=2822344 RepID=A0A916JD42_9BACT|nr:TetR/AcrR family transcriptional regulator [Dyadobacter sp. CECT 9275]CAG4993472.1 hypothetical protein DYBT9275_01176 [Dyadobacter sp. CECT 9275]
MKKEEKAKIDQSTEEKIKAAAYKLFTQKGYAATKTRDIAEEAGINLALLNYYFRSKEKLFELIMADNMKQFMFSVVSITNDDNTTYQEKIALIAETYIDMLIAQPDMPIFVLSEIRNDPSGLIKKMNFDDIILRSLFIRQLKSAVEGNEITPVDPLHIIMNILGMAVFPFIGSPVLKKIGGMSDESFNAMMRERKKLIPLWLHEMLRKKG